MHDVNITEIAPQVYRISIFAPDYGMQLHSLSF